MSTGRLPSTDGGIQPTVVDAKGDLLVGVAADSISRLAVGSNDQVLTADSSTSTGLKWATPASGSLTQIQSITASNQANVEFTSIPQTYQNLYIVINQNKPASDGAQLWVRLNSDATASRYRNVTTFGNVGNGTFGDNRYELLQTADNTVSNSLIIMDVYNYTNTTTFKVAKGLAVSNDSTTATNSAVYYTYGVYNQTNAITSLLFLASTGNITSGTFTLYGVK